MKLYIKQKVFSWGDKFTVKDESGQDKYYVEGQVFSWGKKLRVYDMAHQEVIFIQQKVMSLKPRFFVFINEEQVAEIVKEFTFGKPRYTISGPNWSIVGNFWQHEYQVTENGQVVVGIRKEFISWGDSYALDIVDPKNEIMALAVVLAIDCALAMQQTSNSTNHR